jgi:hypothetical protein
VFGEKPPGRVHSCVSSLAPPVVDGLTTAALIAATIGAAIQGSKPCPETSDFDFCGLGRGTAKLEALVTGVAAVPFAISTLHGSINRCPTDSDIAVAGTLATEAIAAARASHCAEARELGVRVQSLDPERYHRIASDAAFAACLPQPPPEAAVHPF